MPHRSLYEEMGPGVYFVRAPVGFAAARIHYAHQVQRTFPRTDGLLRASGYAMYPRLIQFHPAEHDPNRLAVTDLTYLLNDFSRLRTEVQLARQPPDAAP